MIVSETPDRVISRRLQACALLYAMVVLPVGLTYAQDYEAVGKRLRAAIEAGELTSGQARIMLRALREADGAEKDRGSDRAKAYLANVRKELGALVEEGKISKEDAKKRYQGTEEAVKARMAAQGERKRGDDCNRINGIRERIEGAVKAGKITRKQANEAYKKFRERMGQRGGEHPTRKMDWARIKERIEGAVKRGDMTREQADAKYNEIREGMAERRQR